MDRWACVSVAELPLQLLLRREPSFVGKAVVVVSEDKPQGTVLWVNELARSRGALPGQSYSLALSLVPSLFAGVVPDAELEDAKRELMAELWRFSPRVEAADDAGVFWLDASGLKLLYPQLVRWAHELRAQLSACGFSASVVVGFSRFGTYALARAGRENLVFDAEAKERTAFRRVPLACLDIEPEFRDVLHKLGVRALADLLALPAAGLLRRFGKTAYRLHAMAAGELLAPLAPDPWLEPLTAHVHLDDAETDATRLLFLLKRLLDALLPKLVLRGEAVCALSFVCTLDRSQGQLGPEQVRPAVPTLDVIELMDLLRLRIETLQLTGGGLGSMPTLRDGGLGSTPTLRDGVVRLDLEAQGVAADAEQLRAFAEKPRRDLAAGSRAIARLRAELGEDAVVCAELTSGHLPEASFAWRPLTELRAPPSSNAVPHRGATRLRPLVRRMWTKPEPLDAPPRHVRDDGWLIRGPIYGAVTHQAGPYLVSGGWWVREVQREYRMIITKRGDLLWVFHDRRRRRYFLQGEVG